MSAARDAILARVRESLGRARRDLASQGLAEPQLPQGPHPGLPDAPAEGAALCERFAQRLEAVGGFVHRVADESAAARALADLVDDGPLATSDDPRVQRLVAGLPPGVSRVPHDGSREDLLACTVGLTGAQWGIAETGTLVLESGTERHRVVSLLPDRHVAILDGSRILSTLGEALAKVQAPAEGAMSRAITLITGPSRTADIELTLVVGVHGPKELHVLLLEPPHVP